MDPVEQDIKRHGIEETKYNRAFEALRPIVRESYVLFEGFLMDYYQEYYNSLDDETLHNMHVMLNQPYQQYEMADKWLEYVDREVERRLEC